MTQRTMNGFVDRLDRWATGRIILALTAGFVLFSAVVFPAVVERIEAYSGGVGPLDVEFSFSAQEAYSRIEAYGPEGRQLYAWVEATLDVAFPLIAASLLSLLILFLLRRAFPDSRTIRRLALVPFGTLAADLLENTGILVLLLSYPTRLDELAELTSLVVSAKWILVVTSLVIVVFAAGVTVTRSIRSLSR